MPALQFETKRSQARRRKGKVVVLLLVLLPAIFAILGLVFDGGLMLRQSRFNQAAADAAATAAAYQLHQGESESHCMSVANDVVISDNGIADADVTVQIPPTSGPYAGEDGFVEVLVASREKNRFMRLAGAGNDREVQMRSVAGVRDATAGAAVVVLDPDPPPFTVPGIPLLLPSLPTLLGGLECLGVGRVRVDGAVLVNTKWGGVDQDGRRAGDGHGPPHAISCMPVISLTKLRARDIRVVGGVDQESNYGKYGASGDGGLKCNMLPVDDPFAGLPSPTLSTDPTNVSAVNHGGKSVTGLPIIGPTVTLNPGVYNWIQVLSGKAVFNPGVYIIRGKHPVTQISLQILAGEVKAQGVMFYITSDAAYSAASGGMDDDDDSVPNDNVLGLLPSTLINIGLLSSSFSGLSSPGSPYNGMFLYQQRTDRRPIVLVQENLIGGGSLRGTVYSKWGHLILAGKGTYNARFVAGTMRIVALLDVEIAPDDLLPPAQDIFLVE